MFVCISQSNGICKFHILSFSFLGSGQCECSLMSSHDSWSLERYNSFALLITGYVTNHSYIVYISSSGHCKSLPYHHLMTILPEHSLSLSLFLCHSWHQCWYQLCLMLSYIAIALLSPHPFQYHLYIFSVHFISLVIVSFFSPSFFVCCVIVSCVWCGVSW